jgi:seryl-tRNA synthetase
VIAKDAAWRAAIFEADKARKERNKVQQEVSKKKKAKEECDDLIKQIQDVRGLNYKKT